NSIITIKLEVDVDPPDGATFERRFRLLPSPYSALLYDAPSLFAGKLHALLCRKWVTREKGRDFYDYVWYLQHKIPVNLPHLEERMRQSGDWMKNDKLTKTDLVYLLHRRFQQTDYLLVKEDILPFIKDSSSLDLYGTEFFNSITDEYLQILQ
ncbi:MAG: nucleotidyl transferase AbiEii/AbiGii toxin family protein, partial [Spirochaetales bacterium]|nr:nucleotidyl transferase AbiEii/AbiGii toxin family protein [Spirochaetales bacterium]